MPVGDLCSFVLVYWSCYVACYCSFLYFEVATMLYDPQTNGIAFNTHPESSLPAKSEQIIKKSGNQEIPKIQNK